MSSTKIAQVVKILPNDSDMLPPAMRRRQPVKDILNQRMKQSGRNTPAVARRATEKGAKLSESTLKMILNGNTTNPGVFTLSAIAQGMDIPSLHFIAEVLGESLDDPALRSGRLAPAVELYKEMTPSQRQRAEHLLDTLVREFQYIKNQR